MNKTQSADNSINYKKTRDLIKIKPISTHLSKEASKRFGGKDKINLLVLSYHSEEKDDEIILGEIPENIKSAKVLNLLKELYNSKSERISKLVNKKIHPEFKTHLITDTLSDIATICEEDIGIKYTEEGYDLFYGNDEYSKEDDAFNSTKTIYRNKDTYEIFSDSYNYSRVFRSKQDWQKTVSLNLKGKKRRCTKDELLRLKNEYLSVEKLPRFISDNKATLDKYILEQESIIPLNKDANIQDKLIFYAGVVDRKLTNDIIALDKQDKVKKQDFNR